MLAPGTVLGRYAIEGPLGRGGMGMVYRARHALMGRLAALKVLKPEIRITPDDRAFSIAMPGGSAGLLAPGERFELPGGARFRFEEARDADFTTE
jgi:serine/threonine protein kinase